MIGGLLCWSDRFCSRAVTRLGEGGAVSSPASAAPEAWRLGKEVSLDGRKVRRLRVCRV